MFAPLPDWRQRLNDPIATGLLLSLSLHLLLLALVQPATGGGGMETFVINARLETATKEPEPLLESTPEPIPEPPQPEPIRLPEPRPEPPPVAPETAPAKPVEPLLTSNVPSPAPPLPVPRAPDPPAPVSAPASVTAVSPPAPAVPAETRAVVAPAASATTRNGASAPIGVGIDTTWYLARQVDTHARAAGSITPDYPDEARRRNQEGTLKLMVKIDDLGRVRDVEVVEADLPGVFDESALEAFRKARFHPAMKDGRPVRYQAYIRVVFKLRD